MDLRGLRYFIAVLETGSTLSARREVCNRANLR